MKFIHSIAKAFILSLLIVGQVNLAHAQSTSTASILPPAKTTFVDQNGKPLTGGSVGFFIPGTMAQKTTWQDAAETIPNSNPVILDSAGRALILGSGSYRQIVKDRLNNQIWDQVTATAGSGSTGPTATGDGDLVGTIKPWAGMTAPNQYMFAAGAQISRALFPALFTAITSVQSVTCTSGNTTINGLTDTTNFWIGMTVEVPCLAAGQSTVTAKTSTSVTLAVAPNASTNVPATFFPWGNGNGTTTFTIPDLRGAVIAGNNNMGGTAGTNLTTTFFGATNPNSVGALGGSQSSSITLLAANLPPYTPSGTNGAPAITAGGGSPLGVASGTGTQLAVITGGTTPFFAAGGFVTLSAGAPTFTGTPAAGQTSTPIVKSIVQPTETANYIIKVTPDQNSATASGVTSLGLMTGDIGCGQNVLCTGNVISVPSIVSPCLLNVPIVGTGITTVPGCDIRGALATAAFVNTGTSGATIGLLNTANSWSAFQTFSSTLAIIGTFVGAISAVPTTPATGLELGWFDSTDLRLHDINSAGAIGTTVVSKSCVSGGQFVQTVAANGTITCNTPAGGGNVSNSGTPTAGQPAYWTGATSIQGLSLPSIQTASLTPTATASTTSVMMGIGLTGCSITPVATGRIHFEISGFVSSTATSVVTSSLRFGTGTAPSNGAAATGTRIGTAVLSNQSVASARLPQTLTGQATGLTLGTSIWFDADLAAASGTATIVASCSAFEF